MTIHEAMDAGITAVTQEPWKTHNKYCRLELPPLLTPPPGSSWAANPLAKYSVWAKIIDPAGNLACNQSSEKPINVLLIAGMPPPSADPDVDEWEPWTAPADYEQRYGKRWTWAA